MQKSTIQYLIISVFIVLFSTSCSTVNVVKEYKTTNLETTTFEVPYFINPEMDYVYKANISVYGNELSGIFIAKKVNETTHRIVFTTEFGNKLIDFEISETDFKVNSIVEELNRKILINTLITDFRLLLRSHYIIKSQFENEQNKVYLAQQDKKFTYLFVSTSNNQLYKIINTSKRKEKINILFTSENNSFASKIVIQHFNIKLRIELNHFNSLPN